MIIITSLRPGEKRMISKKEMKAFRQEHGSPPYFEWHYKQKKKLNKCIETFVYELDEIRANSEPTKIKPSKCSLFLTKFSLLFTDLLKTMGID